jgi:hypothetical protein
VTKIIVEEDLEEEEEVKIDLKEKELKDHKEIDPKVIENPEFLEIINFLKNSQMILHFIVV